MNNSRVSRAAARARWFADLSAALNEAQGLLAQLADEQIDRANADRLRLRIAELRAELET